jgi:hypothetical protein
MLLPRPFLSPLPSSLSCRHPSIRTLGERLLRSVHIGCPRYSRRCHLKATSRVIGRWSGGKAKGAVAGTRHFVWCIEASCLNYAAASLRFRVLWSGSYSSQLIQR